jgi:GTPase SAR1 family protein
MNKFEEIDQFLTDIITQGEKWNTLKMVILGHGEAGKTTLLHAIRRNLDSNWFMRVWLFFFPL